MKHEKAFMALNYVKQKLKMPPENLRLSEVFQCMNILRTIS